MTGVVQAILTDKELERLVQWAEEFAFFEPKAVLSDEDQRLLDKLVAWQRSLSCSSPQCQEGGACRA